MKWCWLVLLAVVACCNADSISHVIKSIPSGQTHFLQAVEFPVGSTGEVQIQLNAESVVGGSGADFDIYLCFSYGIRADSNVSTWDGVGCALRGKEDSLQKSHNSLSIASFSVFPRAGSWYPTVAFVSSASSASLSQVTLNVTFFSCPDNSAPIAGGPSCMAVSPQTEVCPTNGVTFKPASEFLQIPIAEDAAGSFNFSFTTEQTNLIAYVRWNGIPTNVVYDAKCTSQRACVIGVPRPGNYYVWITTGSAKMSASVQVVAQWVVNTCPPDTDGNQYVGVRCNQLVHDETSQAGPSALDTIVLPSNSNVNYMQETFLVVARSYPTVGSSWYYFGFAGLGHLSDERRAQVSIYASRYGFPSPVLGEELTAVGANANGTIRIAVPPPEAQSAYNTWYLRLDVPNATFVSALSDRPQTFMSVTSLFDRRIRMQARMLKSSSSASPSSFLWWSGPPCPNNCSNNGACDPTSGLCQCASSSSSSSSSPTDLSTSLACVIPPLLSTQWIIVLVIVGSIIAAMIIAWIVRCYRNKKAYRHRYEEI